MRNSVRHLVLGALIAALYTGLTLMFAPISFLQAQIRVSEALTVLPYFTPAAIPALFIGCVISNFFGGLGLIDIVFGSLTTLVAAVLSYLLRRWRWLVPIPPIILNGIVIGYLLHFLYQLPLLLTMLQVTFGQTVACYVLGYPLMRVLEKSAGRFLRKQ